MKILFAEDDAQISKFVRQGLKEEGHSVRFFSNGEDALKEAQENDFDVLLLDVMLPGQSGLDICRELRKRGATTPILMLTARDSVENRVEGLDAGADDYLIKPFAFSELLARLRALERRRPEPGGVTNTLEIDELTLDLVGHRVTANGKAVELTSREFSLLQLFMRRKGHVLSRTVILEAVWGYDFQGGTNVVDVYVNYLRQKLKVATGKSYIQTFRHRGYLFDSPS